MKFQGDICRNALAALVACLFMAWASPAAAGWWSLHGSVGGGDSKTTTGTVTLRYVFEPLYENNTLAISPLAEATGALWHHDSDDDVLCGGVSGGLMVTFLREGSWRPYLSGEFGAFLISDDEFGSHNMGGLFQFRSKGALGIQFGADFRHSIQVDAAHYSNGGIYEENKGFNTYGVTYGIRF